jgi:hypothetical protein
MAESNIVSAITEYPPISDVVDVFAKWINAQGGIGGHPLQIFNCDNHATENAAVTCARQAISDHVVAVVGWSYAGGQGVPYLNSAHIVWMPCCGGIDPQELTYPNSFPMAGTPAELVGEPLVAGKLCSSVSALLEDLGYSSQLSKSTDEKVLQQYYGMKLLHAVLVPPASSDLAAAVAQATSGNPQCLLAGIDEGLLFKMLPAMASLGQHQRIIAPTGNLDPKLVAAFPSQLEGSVAVGPFLDYNSPQWAPYRAAVAKYHAYDPSKWDYTGIGPQASWVGMNILENIIKGLIAQNMPITAANVMTAMSNDTNVNSNGYGPPMNYTKPFPVKALARNFNNYQAVSIVHNGKFQPYDTVYHLAEPAYFGQPLTDPLFHK